MISVLFLFLFLVFAECRYSKSDIAEAVISGGGAKGSVRVSGGRIQVLLDLRKFDFSLTSVTRAQCRAGITWHIHASISGPLVGNACGAAGGHYDPWFACGGATGAKACANKGGCIKRKYACSPASFQSGNPFSCEVGDWSGKYGKLFPVSSYRDLYVIDTNKLPNMPSRFEISSTQLFSTGKSVVFHCGAPRILCAPFKATTVANAGPPYFPGRGLAVATARGQRVVADLGCTRGPLVEFGGGQVRVGKNIRLIERACGIKPIWMGLYSGNLGPYTDGRDEGCMFATQSGGVFDPTVSCAPGSDQGQNPPGYCQPPSLVKQGHLDLSWRCSPKASFDYWALTSRSNDPYLGAQGLLKKWDTEWTGKAVEYRLMDQRPSTLLNKIFVIGCGVRKKWCTKLIAGPAKYVPFSVSSKRKWKSSKGSNRGKGSKKGSKKSSKKSKKKSKGGSFFVSEFVDEETVDNDDDVMDW